MRHSLTFDLCSLDLFEFPLVSFPFYFLQFPSHYPTIQVMTAVPPWEPSHPHSFTAPHPSTSSSLNSIFLSPGQTVPPSVSPLSPLQIENVLVSPIPMSLIPSPSLMLRKVGATSPQHQPATVLLQSVRSEAPHSQPAFMSAPTAHPKHTHTAPCQNTHPPTNGSAQPLIQVIMTAAVECRCLPRGWELEPVIVIICQIFVFRVLLLCG